MLAESEMFLQKCSVCWKHPEVLGNGGGIKEALNQEGKLVSLLHLYESNEGSDSRSTLFFYS